MNRRIVTHLARVFLVALFATSLQTSWAAQGVEPQYLRIGAGAVNGGGFAIAGAIAGVLSSPPGGPSCTNGGSCGIPGMIAIVRAIPNLSDRLAALGRREIDLVLLSGSEARMAREQAGFRTIAGLSSQMIQIMVPTKSRIKSQQQLAGRRLALVDADGFEGDDGANSYVKKWTESLGLSGSYFITRAANNGETGLAVALSALEKNQFDALVVFGAAPNPEIAAYALSHEVRFIPIRTPPVNSGLSKLVMTAGVYNGQAQTSSIGMVSQLVVRADMPRELVYQICQSIWDSHSLKSYATVTASRAIAAKNAQVGLQWRLHSGAVKYYREAINPKSLKK
ncbi:MAG: TAXI family TRAP transporter solute-binding subunit [Candidatus Pacebacteria bacterium]|nr:TAXI family TRAP transporter solute-binding subunit [Candidatus Paceibacterota bacterium]